MNIALIGYGKMGKEIERIAPDRGITVKRIFNDVDNPRGEGLTKQSLKDVDVCIDFSTPEAAPANIRAASECGKNIVVGTTGWYDQIKDLESVVRAKKIGLLYSPNFSLGMNIFIQLTGSASKLLDKFEEYDVAIGETHHTGKADAPSGTALTLGQTILQNFRRKKELLLEAPRKPIAKDRLQVTSTRVGSVVGKHSVLFDSEADCIELVHIAKNRSGFALGALVAAQWLKGKKGWYTMKDFMGSI